MNFTVTTIARSLAAHLAPVLPGVQMLEDPAQQGVEPPCMFLQQRYSNIKPHPGGRWLRTIGVDLTYLLDYNLPDLQQQYSSAAETLDLCMEVFPYTDGTDTALLRAYDRKTDIDSDGLHMQNIASAVEGLINMIPGVTVDLTSGLGGWITDLAKKRSDEIQNSGYTEYVKPWENMDLGSAYTRGYDWGSNLSLGNLFGPGGLGDLGVPQAADVNSLLNNVGAIKNNTGKIAKTVDLSDEQLKMMVDIAERKFVNNINLTSQAPVITVQGQNTGNTEADRQSLADLLGDLIMERVQSGSVVAVN